LCAATIATGRPCRLSVFTRLHLRLRFPFNSFFFLLFAGDVASVILTNCAIPIVTIGYGKRHCGNCVCEAAGVANNRLPRRCTRYCNTSPRNHVALQTSLIAIPLPTVIVAIITITILLIWNESQILGVIRERLAGESVGAETAIHLSPARIASVLVLRMQRYFFTTLLPAFPSFRRANPASLGSTTRRSRPVLPRFGPSGSREQEHQLATLPPLILHDSRSHSLFRVPSNPGSVIALSSPTASRSFLGQVSAP